MEALAPRLFYLDNVIRIINEYIKYDNDLLNRNKYPYNSKLKYFKLNKKYSLHLCTF
jgi:hypothetical protein